MSCSGEDFAGCIRAIGELPGIMYYPWVVGLWTVLRWSWRFCHGNMGSDIHESVVTVKGAINDPGYLVESLVGKVADHPFMVLMYMTMHTFIFNMFVLSSVSQNVADGIAGFVFLGYTLCAMFLLSFGAASWLYNLLHAYSSNVHIFVWSMVSTLSVKAFEFVFFGNHSMHQTGLVISSVAVSIGVIVAVRHGQSKHPAPKAVPVPPPAAN